jgi:prepilin-type processing-associated H-X9-DG protein/prepilin-type N-terminal cleavage/methylation domain-containing protein
MICGMHERRGERRLHGAFSLVELLVVIGIIAILIAMLMPALAGVRARAEELKCQAVLRSIGTAAQLHAHDHQGYLPIGGWHWTLVGGVCNPKGLGDENAKRYMYYEDQGEKRPVPFTVALALCMGVKLRLDSRENLEEDMRREDVRKLFRCPGQLVELAGWTQRENSAEMWTGPDDVSSYVLNEAVIGQRKPAFWRTAQPPPMGKLSRIKRSSTVFLAMDGRPRDQESDRWPMVFDDEPNWTLYDFQQMMESWAGGKELFDYTRHRYRANVLFLDWHVESVPMTAGGLKTVGVSLGIYE